MRLPKILVLASGLLLVRRTMGIRMMLLTLARSCAAAGMLRAKKCVESSTPRLYSVGSSGLAASCTLAEMPPVTRSIAHESSSQSSSAAPTWPTSAQNSGRKARASSGMQEASASRRMYTTPLVGCSLSCTGASIAGAWLCLAYVGRPSSGMSPTVSVGRQLTSSSSSCESEQQHVVILVRNEGQSQLDQGNMW